MKKQIQLSCAQPPEAIGAVGSGTKDLALRVKIASLQEDHSHRLIRSDRVGNRH